MTVNDDKSMRQCDTALYCIARKSKSRLPLGQLRGAGHIVCEAPTVAKHSKARMPMTLRKRRRQSSHQNLEDRIETAKSESTCPGRGKTTDQPASERLDYRWTGVAGPSVAEPLEGLSSEDAISSAACSPLTSTSGLRCSAAALAMTRRICCRSLVDWM